MLAAAFTLALGAASVLDPASAYDPKIPAIRAVLGYDHGDEITSPENVATYLKALHEAAPERTRLVEYARSYEGRPLWIFVIGAPERLASLDTVKAGLRRLADPRGLAPAERDRLIGELPVCVWLMHGVHGNEISSSDAALAEAYHVLAAQGDAAVDAIRKDALLVIDPMENPDGRARFLFQNLQGRASAPDPDPLSAEHDEPWPGGRANHYLFDMNRDWFALSQPETLGRIQVYLDYFPQVAVDLHEMGGNSSYYFAPPADPINPFLPKEQRAWFETFGKNNAARFDAKGFAYFIRENYDSFYPGYGESWPIFQGAIGMTYEQASARALSFRRTDGEILTYKDSVLHHFTAAIETARTAAVNRAELLRYFADYRASAVAEGQRGIREYVLVPGADPSMAERLARLLRSQGIEVRRADEAVKLGPRTVAAGAFLVSTAQPSARLLRNLLDVHVDQDDAFIKEQDRLRKLRKPDGIYDVTAWSLPLVFDVECVPSALPIAAKATPLAAGAEPRDERPARGAGGLPRSLGLWHTRFGGGGAACRNARERRRRRHPARRPRVRRRHGPVPHRRQPRSWRHRSARWRRSTAWCRCRPTPPSPTRAASPWAARGCCRCARRACCSFGTRRPRACPPAGRAMCSNAASASVRRSARRVAAARRAAALRRHRHAVGHLRHPARDRGAPQGVGAHRRHAGHDRRRLALGGARENRPPRDPHRDARRHSRSGSGGAGRRREGNRQGCEKEGRGAFRLREIHPARTRSARSDTRRHPARRTRPPPLARGRQRRRARVRWSRAAASSRRSGSTRA